MAISDFSAFALKIAVFPSHLIENMAECCQRFSFICLLIIFVVK